MNVKTAYLYGNLDEEIYLIPPEQMMLDSGKKVWRLKKSIYGLKQSGRCWNRRLHQTLLELGLTHSKADPCVYYRRINGETTIIAVYVDDLLMFTNKEKSRDIIKRSLEAQFDMKDLGEARNCLGMRITRDHTSGKIWIDQSIYIEKILRKFNMASCKPISTPMNSGQKLTESSDEEKCSGDTPYREAVGSLLYLSLISRPDISFPVNAVSKFSKDPRKTHWNAVKRIFRYLKGTKNLKFSKNGNTDLQSYSDADWGNESNDRHSITGSCFKLMGGLISWFSKKQRTIALSTVESEYMALSFTIQEVLWLKVLIREIEPNITTKPFTIFCDNLGAIHLAKNNITSQRSKHIDIRHHFIRSHIQDKTVTIEYLPTEDMISDILTKLLSKEKHDVFVKQFGLVMVEE